MRANLEIFLWRDRRKNGVFLWPNDDLECIKIPFWLSKSRYELVNISNTVMVYQIYVMVLNWLLPLRYNIW